MLISPKFWSCRTMTDELFLTRSIISRLIHTIRITTSISRNDLRYLGSKYFSGDLYGCEFRFIFCLSMSTLFYDRNSLKPYYNFLMIRSRILVEFVGTNRVSRKIRMKIGKAKQRRVRSRIQRQQHGMIYLKRCFILLYSAADNLAVGGGFL